MRVLITGNLGYIGTELSSHLLKHKMSVFGLDSGYFKDCLLNPDHKDIPTTIKDIRDIAVEDFVGFDVVIHLAALSNDPIGELDSDLTYQINRDASIKAANLASQAEVKRFIFISTQSIYGISKSEFELDEDASKNPQTSYAKSKWEAEQAILEMSSKDFTTLALRPSTVFGWSPRLRSDIVFNNLLLSGLVKGQIEVHSDGSPWRPIVHVTDLSEAIRLALVASHTKVAGQPFNIGKIHGNYTVSEIAAAAQKCINESNVVFNTEGITDSRSYKVNFEKAQSILGFEARRDLVETGEEMLMKIEQYKVPHGHLMGKMTNRLAQVAHLRKEGGLDESLRFI